jgi:hypothetical protein
MTGTYTTKNGDLPQLYLPDDDDEGWGDEINQNFVKISQHLGGSLYNLRDTDIDITPADRQILAYDITKGAWTNISPNLLGKQSHNEMNDLDNTSSNGNHQIFLRLDGTKSMTNNLNLNSFKIINSAPATQPTDLMQMSQVENRIRETQGVFLVEQFVKDPSTITPENGKVYLAQKDAEGTWVEHRERLMYYNNNEWTAIRPRSGMVAFLFNESRYYKYVGDWVILEKNLEIDHNTLKNLNQDAHKEYLNENRHTQLHQSMGVDYKEMKGSEVGLIDRIIIRDMLPGGNTGEDRYITIEEFILALERLK